MTITCESFVPSTFRTSLMNKMKNGLGIVAGYGTIGAAYGTAAATLCTKMGLGEGVLGAMANLTGLSPALAAAGIGAAVLIGGRALSKTVGRTFAAAPPILAAGAAAVAASGWELPLTFLSFFGAVAVLVSDPSDQYRLNARQQAPITKQWQTPAFCRPGCVRKNCPYNACNSNSL